MASGPSPCTARCLPDPCSVSGLGRAAMFNHERFGTCVPSHKGQRANKGGWTERKTKWNDKKYVLHIAMFTVDIIKPLFK